MFSPHPVKRKEGMSFFFDETEISSDEYYKTFIGIFSTWNHSKIALWGYKMKILLITNNSIIVDKINKFIVNEYPEYSFETDCIQTANKIILNDKFDIVFII